jgi:hypothetical protein
MMRALNHGKLFEKLQSLVASSSSESDPYRSKVAEEMLLCEVIVQRSTIKHLKKNSL